MWNSLPAELKLDPDWSHQREVTNDVALLVLWHFIVFFCYSLCFILLCLNFLLRIYCGVCICTVVCVCFCVLCILNELKRCGMRHQLMLHTQIKLN